ncbi:hypothetical protein ACIQPT_34705 [Streptomyces sp. NPDC091289]|uniref:hypothetical protein n=1 Tax=Streptomyces sp. NPDC091289 TaxID=3365989 RepID=UPI0037F4FF29
MKIRTDIADMLRNGATQQDIMRTLHVGYKTVTAHRIALRLPTPKRGGHILRPIETEFYARTEPIDGGHLRWAGHHANGVPRLGRQGKHPSAYQVAFQMHHGRKPIGHAKPGCGYPQCVAPAHLEDRPMREQLQSQMNSIFGGAL